MKKIHILTIALAAVITSCVTKPEIRKCSGSVWATSYNITYTAPTDLTDTILTTFSMVENSLSPFAKESLISRINRNESTETDSLLRRIFEASQEINRVSGGAFDPTVAPLVNLWGFGYRNSSEPPTQAMIDSALAHVGIARCQMVNNLIEKHSSKTEFNF